MINVHVENLGIIKEADINLRPFTVFIGENNTNKSWLAYSIFGVLSLRQHLLTTGYFIKKTENGDVYLREIIFSIVEEVIEKGYKEIENFPKFVKDNLNLFLNSISEFFSIQAPDFFSTGKELFKKFRIEIQISENLLETITSEFENLPNRTMLATATSLYFFKSGKSLIIEGKELRSFPKDLIRFMITRELINIFTSLIFSKLVILPAERKGSTLIEENLSNLNSLILDFLRKTEESPEEFLDMLSRALLKSKIISNKIIESFISFMEEAKKSKTEMGSHYYQLSKRLSSILGGQVVVNDEQQIFFVPRKNDHTRLPFHITSSLVKSLIPIQLYLEKVASGKDFIVMDEPEMNLHPKAQLQLLETLVAIANGLEERDRNCVLITTHAPYFLEYLEVMLEASKTAKENPELKGKLSNLFEVGGEGALLPPEKLSVYQFTPEGKVVSVFDEKNLTIDLQTFSDVSQLIPEKFWKIEELKEKKYGKHS